MAKSFEQVLEQEKNGLTEALILFGEGKRVNKALADLEMNRPEFYKFYEAGKQSRQAEIENLQKRIKELELINFDSELHFDAAKEHIDLLQKRIDEIDNHVGVNYDCDRDDDQHSYWSGYNQALREIFEMLKGCTNE